MGTKIIIYSFETVSLMDENHRFRRVSSVSAHAVKGAHSTRLRTEKGGGGEPDPEIVDTAAKFVQVDIMKSHRT
jgi:hypothetical protein